MIIQSVRIPLDRGRFIVKALVAQHFRCIMMVARHIVGLGQGAIGQDSWLIVVPACYRGLSFHFRYLHFRHLEQD